MNKIKSLCNLFSRTQLKHAFSNNHNYDMTYSSPRSLAQILQIQSSTHQIQSRYTKIGYNSNQVRSLLQARTSTEPKLPKQRSHRKRPASIPLAFATSCPHNTPHIHTHPTPPNLPSLLGPGLKGSTDRHTNDI